MQRKLLIAPPANNNLRCMSAPKQRFALHEKVAAITLGPKTTKSAPPIAAITAKYRGSLGNLGCGFGMGERYFTLPAVRPLTSRFSMSMKRITTGRIATSETPNT